MFVLVGSKQGAQINIFNYCSVDDVASLCNNKGVQTLIN